MPTLKPTSYIDRCVLGSRCLCGSLSTRQRQVLHRVLEADAEKQIASVLGIKLGTVHVYVKQLYRRFEVDGRPSLMAKAVKFAGRVDVRPRAIKHNIGLREDQKVELRQLLASDGATRQQVRRASILLRLDGRADDYTIAEELNIAIRTIAGAG